MSKSASTASANLDLGFDVNEPELITIHSGYYSERADTLFARGDSHGAIDSIKTALDMFTGDVPDEMEKFSLKLLSMASAFKDQKNHPSAIKAYQTWLKYPENRNNKKKFLAVNFFLGSCYLEKGDTVEALPYLDAAQRACAEVQENSISLARVLNMKGRYYYLMGDLPNALAFYHGAVQEALRPYAQNNHVNLLDVANNPNITVKKKQAIAHYFDSIARCHFYLGGHDIKSLNATIEALDRELTLRKRLPNDSKINENLTMLADTYNKLSNCYKEKNDFPNTAVASGKAAALYEQLGLSHQTYQMYYLNAFMHKATHNHVEAEKSWKKVLSFSLRPEIYIATNFYLGEACMRQGGKAKWEEAQQYFLTGITATASALREGTLPKQHINNIVSLVSKQITAIHEYAKFLPDELVFPNEFLANLERTNRIIKELHLQHLNISGGFAQMQNANPREAVGQFSANVISRKRDTSPSQEYS